MESFSRGGADSKASLSAFSLRLLVEKIPAVLWTTDMDFRLTSATGAALAAMSIHPEEYLGVSLIDFSAHLGPDATPLVAHRLALSGKGSTFDIEILGCDLQAHVEPLRGREGNIVGVIGVALDNTERRVAERALRLSEQSYRSLIEGAPYGICRSTVDGQLLQVNRAMAEMLSYESETELLLRSLRTEIFDQPINYDEFLAQLQCRSSCQGFECTWRCHGGKTILVRLGGWSVLDGSGEISYLEILAENVTERKQLENQLRRAQKMQAIGQLAGGVAHRAAPSALGPTIGLVRSPTASGTPCRNCLAGNTNRLVRVALFAPLLCEFCLLRSGTLLHKKQSPSWRSPATSRPRCQGRGVGVYRSEVKTLDRKSGRSRRSLSTGRAKANGEFLNLLIHAEFVFLKNAMHTEIGKRLASLPKTEASFVEPMDCLSVSKLPEGLEWIWEISS